MRKLVYISLLSFLVSSILLFTSQFTPAAQKTSDTLKVALILNQSVKASFGASQWEGLIRMKKEFGAEITYTDMVPAANFAEVGRGYASNGYNLIFFGGAEQADAAKEVAREFPDVTIINVHGIEGQPPNLSSVTYVEEQGGFLAGALAGLMTKTNKLSFLGGIEIPPLLRINYGFEQGAKYVNKEAETSIYWTGSFIDVVKGKETAQSMISKDIDCFLCIADDACLGAYQAIKGTRSMAIGWAKDENIYAPKNIISSMIADQSEMLFLMAKMYKEGKLEPKAYYMGMKDGIIFLAPYHGLVPQEVEDQVSKITKDILSGNIKIERFKP